MDIPTPAATSPARESAHGDAMREGEMPPAAQQPLRGLLGAGATRCNGSINRLRVAAITLCQLLNCSKRLGNDPPAPGDDSPAATPRAISGRIAPSRAAWPASALRDKRHAPPPSRPADSPPAPRAIVNRPLAVSSEVDRSRWPEGATVFYDVPVMNQRRPADCWYSALQMMLSWRHGEKMKPTGEALARHRKGDFPLVGRMLAFGSREGRHILEENGMRNFGSKLDLKDIRTVEKILNERGPFVVCGKFDPLGFGIGHNLVIRGVDPDKGTIAFNDPAAPIGATPGSSGNQMRWGRFELLEDIFKEGTTDYPGEDSVIVFE